MDWSRNLICRGPHCEPYENPLIQIVAASCLQHMYNSSSRALLEFWAELAFLHTSVLQTRASFLIQTHLHIIAICLTLVFIPSQ